MAMKPDFRVTTTLTAVGSTAPATLHSSLAALFRPPLVERQSSRRAEDWRQLNIWEVRGASLCSIVGARLTLSEL